jgi:DNA-binding MarR family transcriptional regulator
MSQGADAALRGRARSTIPAAVRRRPPNEVLESFGILVRGVRAVLAQAYASFDLGSVQAKFVRHIGENSSISQADLARATSTDPALTGRVVTTLIERGWIRRKRSQQDRREYVVELTAAGKRARQRAEEAREQVAKRLTAVLDDRDLNDIARVGKKIRDLLDESASGDESVAPRRP